jgi:hypothetical protein
MLSPKLVLSLVVGSRERAEAIVAGHRHNWRISFRLVICSECVVWPPALADADRSLVERVRSGFFTPLSYG